MKIKNFKMRFLSLFLAAAMIVPVLSGCGTTTNENKNNGTVEDGSGNSGGSGSSSGKTDSGKNTDKEIVTLNVYTQLANYSGLQGGWIATVLEDKFGVKINIIPDQEGTYETRVETGNLGDIVVWGSDGDDYANAVNLGLLYDWEDDDLLKEYGPYIYENMQAALENNRSLNADGKIYGFGHGVAADMTDHQSFFYTWDMRWDLYKQLGCPEVKDLDGLIDLFTEMKKIQPLDDNGNEAYAMSLWPDWDGDMVMYVKAFATAYWGYDELAGGLFDSDTGEFHPCLEVNEDGSYGPYLAMLEWFYKLNKAGLLDPDSMTATYDTATEKVRNSGVFFQIFNYAGSNVYNTDEHISQNRMMLPVVPSEATPPAYGMSIYGGNRLWTIGAKTEYPELCMEIINWLSTPEGTMALWYGIKGVMWDYNDEGGIYFTEIGKACNNDSEYQLDGVTWTSPDTGKTYTLSGSFNDGLLQINNITWAQDAKNPESKLGETYNSELWESEQGDAKCDLEAEWRAFTGVVGTQQYLEKTNYRIIKAYSGWKESQKSETLKTAYKQIQECITTKSWQAIYASSDAKFKFIVKQMISQCEEYGYDEYRAWGEEQAKAKFAAQID